HSNTARFSRISPLRIPLVRSAKPQNTQEFIERIRGLARDWGATFAPTRPNELMSSSFDPRDAGLLHHLTPSVDFLGDKLGELGRRRRGAGKEAHIDQLPLPLRARDIGGHFLVQYVDHWRWSTGGRG